MKRMGSWMKSGGEYKYPAFTQRGDSNELDAPARGGRGGGGVLACECVRVRACIRVSLRVRAGDGAWCGARVGMGVCLSASMFVCCA